MKRQTRDLKSNIHKYAVQHSMCRIAGPRRVPEG
jgi:hypothetical protein